MKTKSEIISDAELYSFSENVDFGSQDLREVVETALLKTASDFHNGSTANWLLKQLGLITEKLKLTRKGKDYLFVAFSHCV